LRQVKETEEIAMYNGRGARVSTVDKRGRKPPLGRAKAREDDSKVPQQSGGDAANQMASEGGQMSKLTGIALKRAHLVPSAMFASPAAVVRSKALTLPQKIAILRRWEFDVRQRSEARAALVVADETRLLEEVRSALAALGVSTSAPRGQAMRVATH
jgi:hypothetical protein